MSGHDEGIMGYGPDIARVAALFEQLARGEIPLAEV